MTSAVNTPQNPVEAVEPSKKDNSPKGEQLASAVPPTKNPNTVIRLPDESAKFAAEDLEREAEPEANSLPVFGSHESRNWG